MKALPLALSLLLLGADPAQAQAPMQPAPMIGWRVRVTYAAEGGVRRIEARLADLTADTLYLGRGRREPRIAVPRRDVRFVEGARPNYLLSALVGAAVGVVGAYIPGPFGGEPGEDLALHTAIGVIVFLALPLDTWQLVGLGP